MNEETLFHEALARATPAERAAFLAEACAGRPELRSAVEALLAAHEQSGEFLGPPAVPAADTADLAGSTDADDRPAAPATVDGDAPAASPDPAADLPRQIGRYEVRRLLGRGGMGAVYLAHDPELDRLVALKVPQLAGPDAQERFLREARAAAALSHPNLCPVYDVGRAGGVPYLAMAYVPGPTLAEALRRDGPPPPARCAAIAAGVARGMAEAHRHGIVHRDLKPGNILLDRQGQPVITDFGLALRAGPDAPATTPAASTGYQPRLTQAGVLMGTPAYMPPEQARGELDRIGPASDVYALGAILFELLAGRPLFPACPLHEMVRLIETEPAPPPSQVRRGVPPGLDAACRRALAKDPARRFPSMDEFAEALAPFAARRGGRRWGRAAAAAAALALLVLAAGVVLYVKTDYGTVEVLLTDPAADVQVSVDGNEVRLTEGGRVTTLRAGAHGLEVKGPGFETESRRFKVTRGDKTVVEVELKARAQAAGGPGPKVEQPKPAAPALSRERAQLAELLARGRRLTEQDKHGELGAIADEALKIDPESPGALALRATYHSSRREWDAALADANAALKHNPETWQALVIRDFVNCEREKYDDSIADGTICIRLTPGHPGPYLNRARAYLKKGQYRQAIADATEAIARGWRTGDAFLTRGWAHLHLGEYREALADHDDAEKLSPTNPYVFAQRSVVHAKMGNPAKAGADRATALKLDKDFPIDGAPAIPGPPKPPERRKLTAEQADALAAAVRTAEEALKEQRVAESRKAIDEALRLDLTSANAHALRARLLVHIGQFEPALAAANEAIRLDPSHAWAYIARGGARNGLNDHAGAIADYTIALRLNPGLPQGWVNRGNAYYQRGQYHQAVADANEALRLQPGEWAALRNRGGGYLRLGEYEKALDDYSSVAGLQPTKGRWLLICAAIRARLGDADGAANDRERALKIDPQLASASPVDLPPPIPPVKKDPEPPKDAGAALDRTRLATLLAQGRRMIEQGQYAGLDEVAKEALRIDAESPGGLTLRAVSRARSGENAGARADALAALRLGPETFEALVVLASLDGAQGRTDDAIAAATIAARLDPKSPHPWANRAQAYVDRKDYRQAVADATRALGSGPRRPDALLTREAAYVHLGEYENALADLNRAAELMPNNAQVFSHRSSVRAKLGNADGAAADWATARKLNPALRDGDALAIPAPPKPPERRKLTAEQADALAAALKAAKEALREHRDKDARQAIDEAIGRDPTCAEAHAARAWLSGQSGQYEQALKAANEAVRLDPSCAVAYVARGSTRTMLDDQAGSIADLTIALQLNGKLSAAWNSRGCAYQRRGQYHQAVADLNEALRLEPNDANTITNRALCYLFLAEYEKALADFTKAAQMQPENGHWLRMCAAIRARLGDPGGAAKDREQAIQRDPQLGNAPPAELPPPIPPVKKDPELPAEKPASPSGG